MYIERQEGYCSLSLKLIVNRYWRLDLLRTKSIFSQISPSCDLLFHILEFFCFLSERTPLTTHYTSSLHKKTNSISELPLVLYFIPIRPHCSSSHFSCTTKDQLLATLNPLFSRPFLPPNATQRNAKSCFATNS